MLLFDVRRNAIPAHQRRRKPHLLEIQIPFAVQIRVDKDTAILTEDLIFNRAEEHASAMERSQRLGDQALDILRLHASRDNSGKRWFAVSFQEAFDRRGKRHGFHPLRKFIRLGITEMHRPFFFGLEIPGRCSTVKPNCCRIRRLDHATSRIRDPHPDVG